MKNSISELNKKEISGISGSINRISGKEAIAVTIAVIGFIVVHNYIIGPIIDTATSYVRSF